MALTSEQIIRPHVFREYDIRGKAADDLTEKFSFLLGQAFAEKVRENGQKAVVVGHDNRKSSPAFHRALISGLYCGTCEVIDIGEVTTPMFYYSLHHLHTSCGVMITASHNPGDDNGFKIAIDGTTLYGQEIQDLRKRMVKLYDTNGIPEQRDWKADRVRRENIVRPYLDMLQEKIKLGPRKLKVVIDCGNGTPSPFAPQAVKSWGCDVVPLYCESDPDFPNHHPDPVDPNNLQDLIEKVRSEQADLGIAFDGDGDRLGVVDERGNILWGDQLMILFWREILPKYPGCRAIVEVKCSQALVEEIEHLGGKPFYHRTGHSHIKATMRKIDTPFTGEMSGHMFFRDEYYGYDDALYAAGRLLRIVSHTDKPLSALLADVPKYSATPETRVPCDDAKKAHIIDRVKRYFQGKYELVDVDGVRVLFPNGWGLARSSNTQPVIVLRAEAKTEQDLQQIKAEIEQALTCASPDVSVNW